MTLPAPATIRPGDIRRRWADGSLAAGWCFPADWHDPAVDAVCEACAGEGNLWASAERLGRSRASAGVPLVETLSDLDALADLLPDHLAGIAVRAATLGWADAAASSSAPLIDPLTGLVTPEYLNLRLAEVYQAAEAAGVRAADRSAVVVVRVLPGGSAPWRHVAPLILVSEAMRAVFSAGETLCRLSDQVAVALAGRDRLLPRRAQLLAGMVADGLRGDRDISGAAPAVWVERLPPGYRAALDLIDELRR